MGGFIYLPRAGYPDWKNEFDFNVQVDVKSAQHVLSNSNPTLIPISVTAETALRDRRCRDCVRRESWES